jgi:hypothetical protein
MTLYEKIITIYPTLSSDDFIPITGLIFLQNDGNGDYIAAWNHPTLALPTEEQLQSIK